VLGTGGISRPLQGARGRLIGVDVHRHPMDGSGSAPEWPPRFSNSELMRRTGTEGIETSRWLVMRGGRHDNVRGVQTHSPAPIPNAGAGVLVRENTLICVPPPPARTCAAACWWLPGWGDSRWRTC